MQISKKSKISKTCNFYIFSLLSRFELRSGGIRPRTRFVSTRVRRGRGRENLDANQFWNFCASNASKASKTDSKMFLFVLKILKKLRKFIKFRRFLYFFWRFRRKISTHNSIVSTRTHARRINDENHVRVLGLESIECSRFNLFSLFQATNLIKPSSKINRFKK